MHLARGHEEEAIRLLDARRQPADEPSRDVGVEADDRQAIGAAPGVTSRQAPVTSCARR
ncbi:MAG TPA: hypothetical protein VFQ39_04670 [Longimicrobium sp.]|nr:hypothetical protein [Longimicrobium sp.]